MGVLQSSWKRHGWPWLSIETHGDFGIQEFEESLYIYNQSFSSYLNLIWSDLASSHLPTAFNTLCATTSGLGLVNRLHFDCLWLGLLAWRENGFGRFWNHLACKATYVNALTPPTFSPCIKTLRPNTSIWRRLISRPKPNSLSSCKPIYIAHTRINYQTPSFLVKNRSPSTWAAPLPIPGHRAWPVVEGLSQAQKLTRNDA